MPEYLAPLQDMQFVLFDVFQADKEWQRTPSLAAIVDRDVASAMLEEAGKLARHCLAPINRSGDEEGALFSAGEVSTPKGFKAAYDQFSAGGLVALTGNPDLGGLGMPKTFSVLVDEMMFGANSAFYLYPALSAGACLAIDAHADAKLKQRFLPSMYSGEWAGTMCLTEPQAGSDLGLMQTKAEPFADGTYAISGTKIFITGGDQDLTENIVHLVLAKLPGAPAGSRGISLFLVPKIWVNEDGSLGAPNQVSCGSIEHKMGIKASATCVLNFDGARGYLVGEINQGLSCMFTMMNCERLSIGIQGLGSAEASYQNAANYAKERVQGSGEESILAHPDVRRMLLTMKATTEAGRAFAVYLGSLMDQAKYAENQSERVKGEAISALLTPVAKAFFTDIGLESTVLGQQVFGGHGYVREWGQEQWVRDVRIAQIYEGTNGIQALDLLQRKVFSDRGEWLNAYLSEIGGFCDQQASGELAGYAALLHQKIRSFADLTEDLIAAGEVNGSELGASANDYLHMLGYLSYGYMWLQMMVTAKASVIKPGMETKLKTGAFYFARLFPRLTSLEAAVRSGGKTMMAFSTDEF